MYPNGHSEAYDSHYDRLGQRMKRNFMLSLTAVVPVATSIRDLSNLTFNISNALQNGVHVVVVIDQVSTELNPALEAFGLHFSSYGDKFRIVRGNYGSPGMARNAGKQNVDTEFISFWDADDRIEIESIIKTVNLYGDMYDYIIGSYQVVELGSVSIRCAAAKKTLGKLRIIKEPGVWRIVFRNSKVGNSQFGSSFMGEDQVYLVNSGLFSSAKVLFTHDVFYTYFTGVDGQLTSIRRLNEALVRSIVEIINTSSRAGFKELFFRLLVVCRIGLTLIKRIVTGKK